MKVYNLAVIVEIGLWLIFNISVPALERRGRRYNRYVVIYIAEACGCLILFKLEIMQKRI